MSKDQHDMPQDLAPEMPKELDLRHAPIIDEQTLKHQIRENRAELFFATKLMRILKDYFDELIRNANPDSDFARQINEVRGALDVSPRILMQQDGVEGLPISEKLKKALEQVLDIPFEMKEHDEDVVKALVVAKVNEGLNLLNAIEARPVLSHRGREFAPDEASKEAFEALLGSKAAECEFDIRSSADGQPMIHHNVTLGKSAGGTEAVSDFTADELRQDVTLKGGGHIISLGDFFNLVEETGNDVTKINIDIKDFDEAMLDEILRLIKSNGMEHRVTIVSWVPQVLQYLYEKDKSLIYSLSYFPLVRSTSESVLNLLTSVYGDVMKDMPKVGGLTKWFMNKVGSFVAQMRAEAAVANKDKVIGTNAEMITDAHFLDPEQHWTDWRSELEAKGRTGVGMHTFAVGSAPKEGSMTKRVLEGGGSVNVQAIEESVFAKLKAVPYLSDEQRKTLANMFGRLTAMAKFASKCAESGIKVNLFDLKDPENIDKHFENIEAAGVQPGVVYTSNADLVPRVEIAKPGSGALREEDKVRPAEDAA